MGAPAVSTLSDSVYLVDVNHDGKVDLVGDWGAALGNGAGQFGKPIPLPSGLEAITAVAPGDFSNSGKVDLAVAQVAYHAKAHQWLSTSTIDTLSGNERPRVLTARCPWTPVSSSISLELNLANNLRG